MNLPIEYISATWQERRQAREEYAVLQNGLCFYCHEPLSGPASKAITDKKVDPELFPPNFFRYPLHLQHNHTSGLTEGVVHAICNAVMWQYEGK
jgi:hypothetical protein